MVDVNYYTILSKEDIKAGMVPNATEYRPSGVKCVELWDDETLIEKRFHFDANYMLYRVLRSLGITDYRTSSLIIDAYKRKGYDTTGMTGDPGHTYGHSIHAHVQFEYSKPRLAT